MKIENKVCENERVFPSFVPTKKEMEESRERVSELTRKSFYETLEAINNLGTSKKDKVR